MKRQTGLLVSRQPSARVAMALLAGFVFGVNPAEQPALIVTGAIVAIATAQLLLQALVLEDNARARAFYEAAGWRPDGGRQLERIISTDLYEVRYAKTLDPR